MTDYVMSSDNSVMIGPHQVQVGSLALLVNICGHPIHVLRTTARLTIAVQEQTFHRRTTIADVRDVAIFPTGSFGEIQLTVDCFVTDDYLETVDSLASICSVNRSDVSETDDVSILLGGMEV